MDYSHTGKTLKVEANVTIKPYTVSDKAVGGAIVAIGITDVDGLENNPLTIEIANSVDSYTDVVLSKEKAYPMTILGVRMDIGETLVITSGVAGEHIKLNITERYKEN